MPKTYALILQNGKEIIKFKGLSHALTFAQFQKTFSRNITLTLVTKKITKVNYLVNIQSIKQNIDLGHYNKRAFDTTGKYTLPFSIINDSILTPNLLDKEHVDFLNYLRKENIDAIPYTLHYNPFS